MTAVITQYRVLTAALPAEDRADDLFLRAVNFQAGLSYFVSGMSKLFGSSWVQGDALGEVIQTQAYGGGPFAKVLRSHPRLTRALTWATPVWEVAFPLVYLTPTRWARCVLLGVKGFHLAVAATMELPRFVWGFTGSHGAVNYVLGKKALSSSTLERIVLVSAAAVAFMTGSHAASQRALDNDRRSGKGGTELLEFADGFVEYRRTAPPIVSKESKTAPIVILEAGLGNPMDAWAWVDEALGQEFHVVSYHRFGYGRTSSRASSAKVVAELIRLTESTGAVIAACHSIGLLSAAEYALSDLRGHRVASLVVIDGTDPDLLAHDRADRRRVGNFLQSQVLTMFAALSGVYNFAPQAVGRQSKYEPDDQHGTLQFVFSPKNIYRATREYFELATEGALANLRSVPTRYLIASEENSVQQETLAAKLAASYSVVPGSTHRSIIGFRDNANRVADVIREATNGAI